MIRIGVTGTRKGMRIGQKVAFRMFLKGANVNREHLGAVLHHGDCVGADAEAHEIAESFGMSVVIHPPEDPKHRAFCKADEYRERQPYLKRNEDIVNSCDILVAVPSGRERLRSGTWATVRYARKRGTPVVVLERAGE